MLKFDDNIYLKYMWLSIVVHFYHPALIKLMEEEQEVYRMGYISKPCQTRMYTEPGGPEEP